MGPREIGNSYRRLLLSSAATLLGLAMTAGPAFAAARPASDMSQEPGAAIESSADEEASGDIVVTAQRRSQRLSDVPASITALDASQLDAAGVTEIKELAVVTPGLVYNVTPPQGQPTVRGIGSALTTTGNDPSVALYIDGVYMPSQTANVFELNNIERVEVLRGPQGTLYGRNATGGAILVTTRRPTFDFRAEGMIGIGSYNELRADAFINVPISGTLAANFAFSYRDDDGYTRNIVTDTRLSTLRNVSERLRILWRPSDTINFVLSADNNYRDDLTGYALRVVGENSASRNLPGYIPITDDYQVALGPSDPVSQVENRGISLLGTYDLGPGTLTSLTSYRHTEGFFITDTDRTNFLIQEVEISSYQNTFQQDFTFASDWSGPFSMTGGANFYFDTAAVERFLSRSATATTLVATSRVRTDAYSGFVELGFSPLDNLHFIGGVRYSTETKDFRSNNATTAGASSATFSAWTPRFAVRFEPAPRWNVYGSYTQGFKSGVYNTFAVSAAPVPVLPENIDAFEVGFRYSSRGLTASASAFTYDYRDVQVTAIGTSGVAGTLNAASERIRGVDFELSAQLTPQFSVRANAAYTHARFTSFPNAQFYVPRPTGGNLQVIGDATGNRVPRVPEFTAGLDATLRVPLAGGELALSGTGYYTSSVTWNANARLVQPSYFLLNTTASWTSPNERWRVSLWGRNLTDQFYYTYLTDSPQGDGGSVARPRTVGLSLGFQI